MARKSKRTLRKMTPLSRELAKLGNELQSVNTRLMNMTEKVARVEVSAAVLDDFLVKADVNVEAQP